MESTKQQFYFNPDQLRQKAESLHESYVSADPFPHIVMDDFLPEDVVDQIISEFPGSQKEDWAKYEHQHSKKLAICEENKLGEVTRHLVAQFNSSDFIRFLEVMTGIQGLVPDPHLWGGGLHRIPKGGYLNVHADFNYYERLKLDRRLNLLLYLNKDWKEEYGGHIELWSKDMKKCVTKALPVFNRVVVFSTSDYSHHGLPTPLSCPDDRTRDSLALYYYTNGRPREEQSKSHNTIYKHTPEQKKQGVPAVSWREKISSFFRS